MLPTHKEIFQQIKTHIWGLYSILCSKQAHHSGNSENSLRLVLQEPFLNYCKPAMLQKEAVLPSLTCRAVCFHPQLSAPLYQCFCSHMVNSAGELSGLKLTVRFYSKQFCNPIHCVVKEEFVLVQEETILKLTFNGCSSLWFHKLS